jgi:hypothetical protein
VHVLKQVCEAFVALSGHNHKDAMRKDEVLSVLEEGTSWDRRILEAVCDLGLTPPMVLDCLTCNQTREQVQNCLLEQACMVRSPTYTRHLEENFTRDTSLLG